MWPRWLLAFVILFTVGTLARPDESCAQSRTGDRFCLRGGIWPQRAVSGVLGVVRLSQADTTHYEARLAEKAALAPFVELQGLFHLRGCWWAEGDFGWAGRRDIDVNYLYKDTVKLLGIGRIDFFPMFAGIRAIKEWGNQKAPNNIYARGGLSIVIASESPSRVHDTLTKYHFYDPGSKMAFGFAVGTGAEFHYYKSFSIVADIQYRYVRFNYGSRARFDLSGFWLSAGLALNGRK
jgi:hypothetical protein